jgi:hypothetical protein
MQMVILLPTLVILMNIVVSLTATVLLLFSFYRSENYLNWDFKRLKGFCGLKCKSFKSIKSTQSPFRQMQLRRTLVLYGIIELLFRVN